MDQRLFEKIEVECDKDSVKIMPYGREYVLSSSPFFSAITSKGQDLLSRPMALVGEENGKELIIEECHSLIMDDVADDNAVACQYMQSKSFVFNSCVSVEEDGFADCSLTVSSKGRSVAQVFGLNATEDDGRVLSKLWLEIPLKKSVAVSYHYAEVKKAILVDGKVPDCTPPLYRAGAMAKEKISFPFVEQIFITNDEVGVALMFHSDENWRYVDPNNAIECLVLEDEVVLRLHLLDYESEKWKDKAYYHDGLDLIPLTFEFMIQATPIKQFPANPYKEKNMHIDCFKKVLEPYEEFLFKPYGEDSDILMDRLVRMGVNTLYIHEKWNDIQNSPVTTKRSTDRLKLIVDEAHARGIKVIPYFGYEMSTMSPDYAKFADLDLKSDVNWHWYRFPYQRALRVCPASSWQDRFVDGFIKLYDKFGFDGLYIDSITPAEGCRNQAHGCGYKRVDGTLAETYPVRESRSLMQKLYRAIKARGGSVCIHAGSTFPLNMIAYADCLWEGEPVQAEFLKGKLEEVPEGYYRAVYSGRNLGVPVNMLCYSSDNWSYDEAMSNALFTGIIPKPVDVGQPLEKTAKLWKILDGYGVERATWHTAYEGKVVADSRLRVGYYQTEEDALMLVTNLKKQDVLGAEIVLEREAGVVVDAYGGSVIASNCKSFSLDLGKFGHRVLEIKY